MVNVDLLKAHSGNYKLTKDNAAEIWKQLFTMHADMAPHFDAEYLDPEKIPKAQKFVMLGQQMISIFSRLPAASADERQWRRSLAEFKEIFEDANAPLSEFNKLKDAFLEAMRIHAGGLSAEQKNEWGALIDKAYSDMKGFGWY